MIFFEKLLSNVGFDLCGTRSSMSCSVLASFLRNALKYGTELFKECSDSHVHNAFRSSTQLTAGFGDQKIFRQMQKCNLFCFYFLFKTSNEC